MGMLVMVVLGVALLLAVIFLANSLAYDLGWWRLLRVLGRLAPYVFGPAYGGMISFQNEAWALRELGRLEDAVAFVKAQLLKGDVPASNRNTAIDILISAGDYQAALAAEPQRRMPRKALEALGLALIQVNLAEADYNLGRWEAADTRLGPLDLGCWLFPISRAGLQQQRAWIAAHRGRGADAIELCAFVKPLWLPRMYRAEYHFTRAAAFLAQARADEAEKALGDAERLAMRMSSKRNALFMRARVAAARGDWAKAERHCRDAACHPFRGQGGAGLLLWADALRRLDRHAEGAEALRLVTSRDPQSESARAAAELLAAG